MRRAAGHFSRRHFKIALKTEEEMWDNRMD